MTALAGRSMHDVTYDPPLREEPSGVRLAVATDALTGAGTHGVLCRFLDAGFHGGSDPIGVLLVDVDGLADVNRRFGHDAGDELLRRVANVVRGIVASTGVEGEATAVVARTGASELAIGTRGLSRADASLLGGAMRRAIAGIRTGDLPVTASVGVAAAPEDATSSSDLLDAARDALRTAKAHGRNVSVLHDASIAAEGRTARRAVEHLLGMAPHQALRFVYQPIVDPDRRVVASEALCRPQSARFESPAALFEEASRRDAVWALGRVVRAVAIQPLATAIEPGPLFLNVHPHELNDPELLEPSPALAAVAGQIVLEIGECARLLHLDEVRASLAVLRGHGFRVALDDLGAGYAGLGTLAGLELDYVKLDRSLVAAIDRSSAVLGLVERLTGYARDRGIVVVAEGVETQAQEARLVEAGCQHLQGWLYGRGSALLPARGSHA